MYRRIGQPGPDWFPTWTAPGMSRPVPPDDPHVRRVSLSSDTNGSMAG